MKVLLAIDGSKYSTDAAWLLSRLPHRDKLELTILTVISPPMVDFYSPTKPFMDKIVEDDRQFAETQHATTREMFAGANATIDCSIVEGDARECIVIGDTGRSTLARALLGSVSRYVLRHARCSVWITRSRKVENLAPAGSIKPEKLAGAS